jgi:aminoglycoside phosphotransferase family enzyme/predicted kinase
MIAQIVAALRSPACYPHPASDVEVIETHISYVLLAGDYAYKIKKPVALGFLDFSSLDARRHFCEEELRLNRRTAPQVYLDVVAIGGARDTPSVGGEGPALEYAVKMRRFPQEMLFDRLARDGGLEASHVDALAEAVARLHGAAERAGLAMEFGSAGAALARAMENFAQVAALGEALPRELHEWTLREHAALRETFSRRKRDGFVREVHGDLHLGNVVLLDGKPVLFDAIEFNPAFRWIDVMNEVAFTMMDLEWHGFPGLAARFLNAYLERTGDFAGLAVLRFYCVYRALVRAKIACIRMRQEGPGEAERSRVKADFADHVRLATRLSRPPGRQLVVMHGFSGSGKTLASQSLLERLGAVRVRSDVERKRLHRLEASARTGSDLREGMYAAAETDRTYERLAEISTRALASGYPVIVDATFLARVHRQRFAALAASFDVPFAIVDCVAPPAVLRERLERRARAGEDASEAGLRVLELQRATEEPLDAAERSLATVCNVHADGTSGLHKLALA